MSVPKYFEMHRPLLKILADGSRHSLQELKAGVINCFHLTDEELGELLPSGRQTYFSNRIGWAITYLKKAGLIENTAKGEYRITDSGKKVFREGPEIIKSSYLKQFDSFKKFTESPKVHNEEKEDTETPDDIIEAAFEEINQGLADDLVAEIMKLSPVAFEKMVLDLMQKMGYGTFKNAAKTTAVTGDEGIDGIIMEDKLGFNLIYIQAKHWNEDHLVGRPEVQAFVGAIAGKGGKGLFVTTSGFTKNAVEYAKTQHIILMDGQKLAQNMIEHNFGVSTKRVFAVKAIDSDVFDDYQDI